MAASPSRQDASKASSNGVWAVTDRTISACSVVAYGLWVLSVLMIGTGWIVGNAHLGQMGLAAAAAAATATVRGYFVSQNRMIRTAFDYGRESAQHDNVRPFV